MEITTLNALARDWQKALQAALAVRSLAYAPYSKFQVGAAVLSTTGELFRGTNVENASYGLSICAERSALVSAVSQGHRSFSAIAITARPESHDLETPVAPCGACRQFIYEFKPQGGDLMVLMADSRLEQIRVATIDELLPEGFGPELV